MYEENEFKSVGKVIFAVMVLSFLLFGIFSGFFTVQPGEIAFVKRFGEIKEKNYTEGLYFKTPFIDEVVKMTVKNQKFEATASSASKDLQDVFATIALNYAIKPDSVKSLYEEIGTEKFIDSILISPAIQESVKAATAKYNASELITDRASVRKEMIDNLTSKIAERGITIIDLNIINFQFSESFNQAIEEKVRAEQEAFAEKNKLEKVKFQQQQEIEKSKAEAEKIRIQAEAIQKQGGAEYVKLQWIKKRNGQLPTYMLGDDTNLLMKIQ